MSFFTNLKLAVRLGIAFGALAIALVVTAAVSFNGLSGVDASAHKLAERDVAALMELVAISEDFLATDGDVARHLYVEDGDLEGAGRARREDRRLDQGGQQDAGQCSSRCIESGEGKETFAEFAAAYKRFETSALKAVELSRQETVDGVEERDGSRTLYTGTVLKELEGLDVIHDEIEDVIDGPGARAGRGRRRHRGVGQAPAPDRRRDRAAGRGRPRRSSSTRGVTKPVAALASRLRSLNDHCLEALTSALEAMREGDLTHEVTPVTTPVDVTSTRRARPAVRDVQRRCSARRSARVDCLQRDARAARVADRRGLGERRHRVVRLAADGVHLRGGRPRRRRDRLGRHRRRPGRRAPGPHGRDHARGRAGGRHRGRPQRRHRP